MDRRIGVGGGVLHWSSTCFSCGSTWFHLDQLGFRWLRLASFVITVLHLISLGFTWVRSVSLGFTRLHLVSHGFNGSTSFHLRLLGLLASHGFTSTWIHLAYLGFARSHLNPREKGTRAGGKNEKGRPRTRNFHIDLTKQTDLAHVCINETNRFLGLGVAAGGLTPPNLH